jgi:hypothetical protein
MSENMGNEHKWVVDQVNEGWVKLCSADIDDLSISLPSTLIPSTAVEGHVLICRFDIDVEMTQKMHNEMETQIEALSTDDDGGDFSL